MLRTLQRLALVACATSTVFGAIVVKVQDKASHSIPSTLYGQMFEDIGHSGDGGMYAELLQNRAFQQVDPSNQAAALYAWAPIGGANISVIASPKPVSSALPNSLKFTVPSGASGDIGFGNLGYNGINVNESWTYNASFYYKIDSPSHSGKALNVTASLVSSTSGKTLASKSASLAASSGWKQVHMQLKPSASAPDNMNNFTITVDGASAQGASVEFALLSLFPPTFKNRPNGIRVDIGEALADMATGFFRFPGGNNMEGQTIPDRWIWNNTVGPLLDRPGRQGDWGYVNTDGLGLFEFLQFIEDANMGYIMAVWDGYTLGEDTVAPADLGPYIQSAIDQINFAIGDPAKSDAAAMRASMGHPEPFPVDRIEIGNEDWYTEVGYSTYQAYRWQAFHGNLSAAFPQLKFMATTLPFNPILEPTPKEYDVHIYNPPSWFAENTFYYDDFKRNGTTYLHGEYAANSNSQYPDMESSVTEAAFMTGFERNADIVFGASYSPLVQSRAFGSTHGLVNFDSSSVLKTTGYWVQKLFHDNQGDEYLPSTLPNRTGELFWSVTRRKATNEILFKVVNTNSTDLAVEFELPFGVVSPTGTATLLHGAAGMTASNTATQPNAVVPNTTTLTIDANEKIVRWTSPAWSVGFLNVVAS